MRIENSAILWPRSLATPGVEQFKSKIIGQSITAIDRRGKFLIIKLGKDSILVHLRMSGDIWIEPKGSPIAAHHRMILDFEGAWRMAFNDPRKFGRIWLVDDPDLVVGRLGPEPLAPDFTAERLYQMLLKHRRQLKPLLMDQSFLAGMGNIYTDEALHLARLHPLRTAAELTLEEAERLWGAVLEVLNEGIRRNGASIDWVYRGGEFQNYFHVYGRKDEPCPNCGSPICRIIVGQRSTYYCPNCQVV